MYRNKQGHIAHVHDVRFENLGHEEGSEHLAVNCRNYTCVRELMVRISAVILSLRTEVFLCISHSCQAHKKTIA